MEKILSCLIIYLHCAYSDVNITVFNLNNDDKKLFNNEIDCIVKISETYLKFNSTVIIINEQNMKNYSNEVLFINKMTHQLMKHNVPIAVFNNTTINVILLKKIFRVEDITPKYGSKDLIIILFNTCEDILSLNLRKIDKDLKYLCVVICPSANICIHELNTIKHYNIFKHDFTFMFLNISNEKYEMVTFIPSIDEKTCKEAVNKPTKINISLNGTLNSKEIFPTKHSTNLNKCPLRVGMATLYPFSQIKHTELLQTYDSINETEGSDMILMQIVSNYFNATLELHYIYRKEENPIKDHKFLEFMLNGSLDVCAGGFYRIYGDVVEYSGIYARQAIVWIYYVQRDERSWQNLFGKTNGLYIFVVLYITYSFIWYFIRLFDGDAVSLRNTLLYGWGALVGATSLQDARSFKQKIVNLGYLILSMHFSAYISIQMYSFLAISEPPKMLNTNDEIMNSGRIAFMKPFSKYFINDKKYINFANTSENCVSFSDCSEKVLMNRGITVSLEGKFYKIQSATSVNDEARLLRANENILTVYNEMLLRKDSPLVVKFREVIKRLFEAGITERLYNEAIGILVIDKAANADSNIRMDSYSCQTGCSITFSQFAGVFYLWASGCVLSCIGFVVEICIKRENDK